MKRKTFFCEFLSEYFLKVKSSLSARMVRVTLSKISFWHISDWMFVQFYLFFFTETVELI